MLAPLAGGWRSAALLPLHDALTWAEEFLKEKRWQAYEKSLQAWASMLPAFVNGGTPPEAPDPPED